VKAGATLSAWAEPERILERIPLDGRPLIEGPDRGDRLTELLSLRLADYARASDLIINANRPLGDVLRKIRDEIH
jgi:shikimate kinase